MTMKLALDYDDTLDQCPEFFSDLTKALKIAGWEIHIVTHIHEEYREYREKQLVDNKITYDKLACTGLKKEYCIENGIKYIFDDVPDYFRAAPRAYLSLHVIKEVD